MIILAIIALIVIPPEKLPEVAKQLAIFLNDLKRSTSGILNDIKRDAMLKPEDLQAKQSPAPPKANSDTAEPEKKPNEPS